MQNSLKNWWKKYQAKKQEKLRNDFLPEAMEIIEQPTSPLGATVVFVVTAVVLFFTGWAIWGRIDEVVSARGKIVNVTGTQVVQTNNGGIIREICVKEGDHVVAGQELVILDASVYEITLQNTSRNIELLEYENELLQRLLNGDDINCFTLEDAEKAEIQKYVLSLKEEYESQQKEILSEVKKADVQIEQQRDALDSLEMQKEYLEQQQEILEKIATGKNATEQNAEKVALAIEQKEVELEEYRALYDAGAIARTELVDKENELELMQKEYEIQKQSVLYEDYDNTLRLLEVGNQIKESDNEYVSQGGVVTMVEEQKVQAESNRDIQKANFESKISGIIVENQASIMNQKAEQEIQTIEVVEQKIISPVAGTLKTLEVTTEGGVLGATQQIATIVPDEGQMLAEIEVLNKDIGYIAESQNVSLKLDTYNFQKYGKLDGIVINVGPDASWSDQKGWVYTVKVAIDSEKFEKNHPDAMVGVGMEGTAEVKVADRPIIDFFMEPIVDHFDGSLKVR